MEMKHLSKGLRMETSIEAKAATVRSTGTESETDEGSREEEQLHECMRCGACCLHMGYPPYSPEEKELLPDDIKFVIAWFGKKYPNGSVYRTHCPCHFFNLQTRECLLHEHKPKVCIDFEPGSKACEKLRSNRLTELDWLNESL